jgi:hypothetical protein
VFNLKNMDVLDTAALCPCALSRLGSACGIRGDVVCLTYRTSRSLFGQSGGSMRCSSCGKIIPNDSNFCNYCGKPVVQVTATQGYAPKKCALCNGQGRDGGIFSSNVCSACGGKGSVLVINPPMKCALCQGSGRKSGIFDSSPCPACNGTGWAHIAK